MKLGALSSAELIDRLRHPGLRWQTGPFCAQVQTTIPGLIEALCLLYADYPLVAGDGVADFHLRVERTAGLHRWWRPQARFVFDGTVPFEPFPLQLALPLFEWGLNWCIVNYAHQFLMLHAAVVERGGRALLMPAPSGSGKSTLCAALVHRGWRLLSDELALMRPRLPRLIPVPRPVSLKEGSIAVIQEFAPEAAFTRACADSHKGLVAHMRAPASSVARAGETAPPAWIVFPSYQGGAPARLQPLPRARAFLRLVENALNYSLLGVRGFETLASLLDGCACYEFRYGDLEEATAFLRDLTASREAAPGLAQCMSTASLLLLKAVRRPEMLAALPETTWDVLLRQARHTGLLPRLAVQLEERGLVGQLPPKVCDHLEAARAIATERERVVRWEVNRLQRALRDTGTPLLLLKGAAYIVAELPPARGRLCSDVDILVPREKLAAIEQALIRHGWQTTALDAYDQEYYRKWTHELPPLEHRERGTTVDVHHSLAPVGGRWRFDSGLLLAAACPVSGVQVQVLAPADMVLHSAVHLLQDGEFERGLRDLTDLDDLLRHFGAHNGFWDLLLDRARQLGLETPLGHALRSAQRLLGTPVPAAALSGTVGGQPTATLMETLTTHALLPEHPDRAGWDIRLARWLLYLRAHWQRMPPLPLAYHLLRKGLQPWLTRREVR